MIRGISNCDVSFMYSNPSQNQKGIGQNVNGKSKQQSIQMAQIVASAAGAVAVLGAGAYYFTCSKKVKPMHNIGENEISKNVKKVSEKWFSHFIKPDKEKGILNFVVFDRFKFNKHVKSNGYKSFDAYVKGGFERNIEISKANGKNVTIQDFLTPNKLVHQRTVYRDDEIIRYDFAYNNSKPVGYAKEVLQRGNQTYVEPLNVKMFDGRKIEEKFIDNLYENVSEFNPENM